MKKRMISLLTALALCLTLQPVNAFAAEDSSEPARTGGLCAHHTAHDETCGYAEGTEGSPCTHEHGEECYTEVTNCVHTHTEDCYPAGDNSVSDNDVTSSETAEPTECSHVCSEENGCIVRELNCPHMHDDECGYVPATEASPCTYVCELCGLTEITAWSWVETSDAIDPVSGVLALSGASAEKPVLLDEVVALLPTEIVANTEDGTENVTLDSWSCPDYPETGAYTGSYVFAGELPEGYTLAENVPAIAVTVEFDSVAVMAAGDHEHPICGTSCTDGKHDNIRFGRELKVYNGELAINGTIINLEENNGNTVYSLEAGNYYLGDDLVINHMITVKSGDTVNLCLNGKKISCNVSTETLHISGGTLNVTDCKDTGAISHAAGTVSYGSSCVGIYSNGNFNLYGGSITDGKTAGSGGGVYMGSYTVFHMYGGKIYGNSASNGGGAVSVASNNSKFYMHDGEIYGNSAIKFANSTSGNGGAVYVGSNGTFYLEGGKIYGNYAERGGGVYNGGVFSMSGGVITGNSSQSGDQGGGVYNLKYESSYLGKVSLSGNVVIRDNFKGGTKNGGTGMYEGSVLSNLYLHHYNNGSVAVSPVDIEGKMGENACVYISIYKGISPEGEDGIAVSTECAGKNVEKKFFSDNDSYEVYYNESNNKLMLRKSTKPAHTHKWKTEWSHDALFHWRKCEDADCKEIDGYDKHSGGTATCKDQAVCSICNYSYGELNPDKHAGGTEVRDRVEPTTTTEGYTGNTYCKGCGKLIQKGETIPKLKDGSGGNTGEGGNSGGNTGSGNSGGSTSSGNDQNTGNGSEQNNGNSNDGGSDNNTPVTVPTSGNDGSTGKTPENPTGKAGVPTYVTYTVQKGDTLGAIARKYGCTVSEIMAANSDLIKNPNLIYVGWQLRIPQNGTTSVDNTSAAVTDQGKTGTYIVKPGDTLWAISRKCSCSVTEIVALNGNLITNPDRIFPGWELKIPQD